MNGSGGSDASGCSADDLADGVLMAVGADAGCSALMAGWGEVAGDSGSGESGCSAAELADDVAPSFDADMFAAAAAGSGWGALVAFDADDDSDIEATPAKRAHVIA